jgi:outer membrane protein assembly factor BamB
LFDPTTSTFAATGSPSVPRGAHSATLLNDGTVLVVGGQGNYTNTQTAEIYDPTTQTFVAAGAASVSDKAIKLMDGNVLFVGRDAQVYVATTPIPATSLTMSPSSATLQVGESRTFSLVDQLMRQRHDAQWGSSDPNVATVDPATGLVTAVAPGSVIVTGSLGFLSADVSVTIVAALPAGALRWTINAPPIGEFTTTAMVQSTAPDDRSPALFAVHQSTTQTLIQALTSDGGLMWQFQLPAEASNFVPNKSGGLLVTLYNGCDNVNPMRLLNIDGPTGLWGWEFTGATNCGSERPRIAIRADGAVVVATPGNYTGFPGLMILDGDFGTVLTAPQIPSSSYQSGDESWLSGYSRVGPAMVDRHGVVHMLYEQRVVRYPPEVTLTRIFLMRVHPNNVVTTTQLSTDTNDTNLFPGNIIPDGEGGVIATWIDRPIVPLNDPPAQSTIRAARVTAAGAVMTYDVPLVPPVDLPEQPNSALPVNPEMTLGENGRAFVTYEGTLVAFDVATGGLIWQYDAPSGTMRMIVSDNTNGIVAANTLSGVDIVRRFTSGGIMSTLAVTGAGVEYTEGGGWIGVDPAQSGGQVFEEIVINVSQTGWWSPTQQNTRQAKPWLIISDGKKTDPEQSVIRNILEQARNLLTNDVSESDTTCSTWFNTAFPLAPSLPTTAAYIDTVLLDILGAPDTTKFAHGIFEEGGSIKAGERTMAVVGDNINGTNIPIGHAAGAFMSFNRNSMFFVNKGKFFGYKGGQQRLQLTIALHEIAHVLQDLNPATVPGFTNDGGDPTGQKSVNNTRLLLKKCKVMIERVP